MRIAFTIISIALAAGCTDAPVSQQVPAGGSITLTLSEFEVGLTPGYGSTLGGEDAQRGAVRFVLCPPELPGCNPDPNLPQREGYELETSFITRLSADPASVAAMATLGDAAIAVVNIPSAANDGPPPATYRLEPRLRQPNAPERLLVPEYRVQTVTIVPGEGEPTTVFDPAYADYVPAMVPPPSVTFFLFDMSGASPLPAAGELRIRYPEGIQIVTVSEDAFGFGADAMIDGRIDAAARTIHVRWLDPLQAMNGIKVAFTLDAGASPVAPSGFSVLEQTLYDLDGEPIDGALQYFVAPDEIR